MAGFSLLHRGIVAPMPVALDQTRREWEQGNARFQRELRETQRPDALRAELDAVTAALRRRIGQSFSL